MYIICLLILLQDQRVVPSGSPCGAGLDFDLISELAEFLSHIKWSLISYYI